jgi:hypothetical protein
MRIRVEDPARVSELRDYFRRLGCLAFIREDGLLNVYTDKATEDEPAKIRTWLNAWVATSEVDATIVD